MPYFQKKDSKMELTVSSGKHILDVGKYNSIIPYINLHDLIALYNFEKIFTPVLALELKGKSLGKWMSLAKITI